MLSKILMLVLLIQFCEAKYYFCLKVDIWYSHFAFQFVLAPVRWVYMNWAQTWSRCLYSLSCHGVEKLHCFSYFSNFNDNFNDWDYSDCWPRYIHLASWILLCFKLNLHADLSSGVKLFLHGVDIANDSYVNVNDIGVEDPDALLCHTNNRNCCTNMIGQQRAGEWYYPNGTRVGTVGQSIYTGHTSYFFRSRGTQTVLLKRESYPSEIGKFCCKVPNASNLIQFICANVGMLSHTHTYT